MISYGGDYKKLESWKNYEINKTQKEKSIMDPKF